MRITGGTHRSRALRAPAGSSTRPTSDRVRESLFGILDAAERVKGARVLDLYAGTGALALEALSRGAARAVLVESSCVALGVLRGNVAALGLTDRARVMAADLHRASGKLGALGPLGPFDLVLADPPWAAVETGEPLRVISELSRSGALAAGALIVLEHASRTPSPDPAGLRRTDVRLYGDTGLSFYVVGDRDRMGECVDDAARPKSASDAIGGVELPAKPEL